MRQRKLFTTGAAALLAATAALVLAPAGGVAAQEDECDNAANPTECGAGVWVPGRRTGNVIPIDDIVVDTGPNNICSGDMPEGSETGEWHIWQERIPNIPPPPGPGDDEPGAVYWVLICDRPVDSPSWLDAINRGGWSTTGPPALPPTPAQIRDALWAEVVGLLYEPEVDPDPAIGLPAKYNVPTFVGITNPQPAVTYVTTVQGITVWIDVVPEATLHPGEPGAPAVPCDEDGTAFDPNGAMPRAQQAAAGGNCTYTYTQRTGAAGRPDAWTADVTIDWDVTWGSNVAGPGNSGTLTAAPSVTTFPRVVDEVQGVVVQAGQ